MLGRPEKRESRSGIIDSHIRSTVQKKIRDTTTRIRKSQHHFPCRDWKVTTLSLKWKWMTLHSGAKSLLLYLPETWPSQKLWSPPETCTRRLRHHHLGHLSLRSTNIISNDTTFTLDAEKDTIKIVSFFELTLALKGGG